MYHFEIERWVNAPAHVVWTVVSDVVGYAHVAPNLSKAEVLEGEGLGMWRRCYDRQGRGWNEQCVAWDEGHAYSMAVDTNDYPYPFSKMQGTWRVEAKSNGALIKKEFEYLPKYGPIGWVLDRAVIKPAFHRICEKLLDNWEAEIAMKWSQA